MTNAPPGSTIHPIRYVLEPDQAHAIATIDGLDLGLATRLLFGDAVKEWPDGYSLICVGLLPPELEQLLQECGLFVLSHEMDDEQNSPALWLITPESDRKRLACSLSQWHTNRGGTLPDQEANHIDDDSSDEHSETSSDLPGSEYCTPLMMAAALGDAELIQTLLNAGADPNERNQNGATALMMAAEHNHISLVRVLLHNPKTQVNVKDSLSRDALSYSAARGNLEVFALLLTFGGAHLEKNPTAATNQHPLFVAARKGNYPICELIFKFGVDIDLVDTSGLTALWYAAANNQIECCSQLLDKGADLRITTNTFYVANFRCRSVFYTAVETGRMALFDLLLEHEDPIKLQELGSTLLKIAAISDQANMVKRLFELERQFGLNLHTNDVNDHSYDTALNLACYEHASNAAKMLLEYGANPNIPGELGHNALVHAAQYDDVDLLKLLIQCGAELQSKWHFGYKALAVAIRFGALNAIEFLLSVGAPASLPAHAIRRLDTDKSLLMLSLSTSAKLLDEQRFHVVALLLSHGASIFEIDDMGNDILMRAVQFGDQSLVDFIIRFRVKIGQMNTSGLNALELAAESAGLALSNTGVFSLWDYEIIYTFQLVLEQAKRQIDWNSLRSAAIGKAMQPIIREMLMQTVSPFRGIRTSPNFSPDFPPVYENSLAATVRLALCNADKDWDRTSTEIQLTECGTPLPVINFLCAYIKAVPLMRFKLFGPTPLALISEEHFKQFFSGIMATMEKLALEEDSINDAYNPLGWHQLRDKIVSISRLKIRSLFLGANSYESSLIALFTELFEKCLYLTVSKQHGAIPKMPPAPGMIAAQMMSHGVYAALALEIDNAWRTAWETTFMIPLVDTANASTTTPSALSSSGDFSLNSLLPSQSSVATNNDDEMGGSPLSDLQSSQLLLAFREALKIKVDYADLLKLPDALAEEATLYADLMYRQIYMLMQFIRPQIAIEEEPAPRAMAQPITTASHTTTTITLAEAFSNSPNSRNVIDALQPAPQNFSHSATPGGNRTDPG